jgi:predicted hydrocarbon binding protein
METNLHMDHPLNYFLQGLQEIISPAEMARLTGSNLSGMKSGGTSGLQKVEKIRLTMTEMYGEEGARGLLMCSGRAAFKHLLEEQGKELGFEADVFRFSPNRIKMKRGLELLARWMGQSFSEGITVGSTEKAWILEVKRTSSQLANQDTGMCDYLAGLIQGFLFWAGGGRFYSVRETCCCLLGDESCCFSIDKYPLD